MADARHQRDKNGKPPEQYQRQRYYQQFWPFLVFGDTLKSCNASHPAHQLERAVRDLPGVLPNVAKDRYRSLHQPVLKVMAIHHDILGYA